MYSGVPQPLIPEITPKTPLIPKATPNLGQKPWIFKKCLPSQENYHDYQKIAQPSLPSPIFAKIQIFAAKKCVFYRHDLVSDYATPLHSSILATILNIWPF